MRPIIQDDLGCISIGCCFFLIGLGVAVIILAAKVVFH